MIKKLINFLMFSIKTTKSASEKVVIIIDHAHMQLGDNATSKSTYILSPTKEFIVDFSDYVFSLWPESEPQPDIISFIISQDQQYDLTLLPNQKKYNVAPENLQPKAKSAPFKGLKSGDTLMIAIGKHRTDEENNEDVLRVHWLGLAEVK